MTPSMLTKVSSILHLHLFAMLSYIVQPHMFMFKSSLNKQKTVYAFCAPCKSYVSESECFYLFFGVLRVIFLDYVLLMHVFALCFCLDSFVCFHEFVC